VLKYVRPEGVGAESTSEAAAARRVMIPVVFILTMEQRETMGCKEKNGRKFLLRKRLTGSSKVPSE
jgi:hypothetical protein